MGIVLHAVKTARSEEESCPASELPDEVEQTTPPTTSKREPSRKSTNLSPPPPPERQGTKKSEARPSPSPLSPRPVRSDLVDKEETEPLEKDNPKAIPFLDPLFERVVLAVGKEAITANLSPAI